MKRPMTVLLVALILAILCIAPRSNAEWKCSDKSALPPNFVTGEQWTIKDDKSRELTTRIVGTEGGLSKMEWASGDVAFYDEALVIQKVVRKNGEVLTKAGAGAYVTIGLKALDFPLEVGKKWDYSYMSPPASGKGTMQTYFQRYEAVACQEVAVPAGKFDAFKIRVDQSTVGFPGGTFYLWWAPEAKNYVKRQYVYSQWWSRGSFTDYELIKYERK